MGGGAVTAEPVLRGQTPSTGRATRSATAETGRDLVLGPSARYFQSHAEKHKNGRLGQRPETCKRPRAWDTCGR